MKAEWNSATATSGELYVMMALAGLIVQWSVDNLDLVMLVCIALNVLMVKFISSTFIFGSPGASTPNQAHFGQGSGQIWLDDVACTGTEARLLDCTARPIGTHNCNHNEDAGTRCIPVFSKFPESCTTNLSK